MRIVDSIYAVRTETDCKKIVTYLAGFFRYNKEIISENCDYINKFVVLSACFTVAKSI